MSRSLKSISLSRSAVVGALALSAVIWAPQAAAQGYCPVWTDVLLDTSSNCVASPLRDRAFDVDTFEWGSGEFVILNRGNELDLLKITDDTAHPVRVDTSGFDFGNRGDSDYDLLSFDVCDDCRYGVLAHKVKRTVIFDMGTAGTPTFPNPPGVWQTYDGVDDSNLGGVVFKKGSQEYLIAAQLTDDCGNYSALYALNGVSNLNFLECVEADGDPIVVKNGQPLHAAGDDWLYLAESNGHVHVYKLVGSGTALTLSQTDTPAGMSYRLNSFSIDDKNLLAASGDYVDNEVTFWDLADPAHPTLIPGWTLSADRITQVAFRSPSPGNPAMLFMAELAGEFTTRTFLVDPDSGPLELDPTYWTDTTLPHNDVDCEIAIAGALAPDGSALYLSRYSIHQVFDISNCLGPVAAVADVVVSPSTVFPGDGVSVADWSLGNYSQWALWVTNGSSPDDSFEGGFPDLSSSNPHSFDFTVPVAMACGTDDYYAHVEVDNIDPPPEVNLDSQHIGVDCAPEATFTITPAVTKPDTTRLTGSGPSTNVVLSVSGTWKFDLRVDYPHATAAGGLYHFTAPQQTRDVSSVAADFSISPSSPLDTQDITLNGGLSQWAAGAALVWDWQIAPDPVGFSCPATQVCTIPADTLEPDTDYIVTLTLTNTNPNPDDVSVMTKDMHVGNGAIQPEFSWSPTNPDKGETTTFRIDGLPDGVEIDRAYWNFANTGCDGGGSSRECISSLWNDCKGYVFEFSTSGPKDVTLQIQIDGVLFPVAGPIHHTVTVTSAGSCGGGGGDCTYSISPTSRNFGPVGGTASVSVDTQSGCGWSVSSVPPWVTINNGFSHSGDGTVSYTVAANVGRSRSDGLAIAGKLFIVTQDAPWVGADFTMSKVNPDIGEVVNFTVNPILDIVSWNFGEPDCDGNPGFIQCQGVGVPPGYCNNMSRTFTTSGYKPITMVLTDGRSQTKGPTVMDRGECCYLDGPPDANFTISTSTAHVGEPVSFTDTSSKALALAKEALAVDFSWQPSDPEIGDGVLFSINGLTEDVVKATWSFGDPGCDGGGAVRVCTPDIWNSCTAYSFSFASGGAKAVTLELETASGTTTIGPRTVNVASTGECGGGGGGGCSYSLDPPTAEFAYGGGPGSFAVNTTAECAWDVTESYGWIDVNPTSGVGSGTVNDTVAENADRSRTAYIRVEGSIHRVDQAGAPANTAPTEWLWTITLDGELVTQSTAPNFTYSFEEPGIYAVELKASNCMGSDTRVKTLEVKEAVVNDFVVGAAVKLKGVNDTTWQSDFRFFNPCGEPLDVRIEYQPAGTNNSGGGLKFREFTLDEDETKVFSDITEAIPDLVDEELTGSVNIESFSDSGCKVVSASRTFNLTDNGTLGLFMPALPKKAVGSQYLDLTGLANNKSYRSNLRLVNLQEEDAWVWLTVLDRSGAPLASRGVWVLGDSTLQLNDILVWITLDPSAKRSLFTVRVDPGGADVQALGSFVDNTTGDSVLSLPSFQGENKLWLPGAAHNTGENDSMWRTDLWLLNPTEDWMAGEVEYVVGDSPDDRYGFEWPVLGPGSVVSNPDIVGDLLGGAESLGYLVVTGKDGGPAPQVAARTYSLDPSGGTNGLGLPAFGSQQLLPPGEAGFIPGISNSANNDVGFRTNLGLLNTDQENWSEVWVTLYDVDGVVAAPPINLFLAPGVLKQFNIFNKFGLGDIEMTGSIKVEVVGGGSVAAYCTETDNQTQDSIFIPTQKMIYGSSR
ncbi:MAG: BACON domain-containing carbohydrate-binding protein [Acidobacteriota bacterium]